MVQQWPKIGRTMFQSMLAGRSFASILDLGPTVVQYCLPMYLSMLAGLSPASIHDHGATVAKDWRPMYRFMLAGRSFASIPDLGLTVAQDWSDNVSVYVGRPVFRQYS